MGARSIAGIPRGPWKRNDVADVSEPGDIRDRSLEAEAEPGVRHRAVTAQVSIPAVVRLVEIRFVHSRVEHVEPLLALAAADDFADARREHVHRRDRPAVVVTP